MKITSYYPQFVTDDFEKALKEYTEALGFEVRHKQEVEGFKLYVLKHPCGHKVDLIECADYEPGFFAMRMNVDNLEEAIDYYIVNGGRRDETAFNRLSARYALVNMPNGKINIVQHIKDDE